MSGERAEPDFDLVEPTGMSGREVDGDIGVFFEPFFDLFMFMDGEVVGYHVDLFLRVSSYLSQHGYEFLVCVLFSHDSEYFSSVDVEGGEQAPRGSVPDVVGVPHFDASLSHRVEV